MIAEQYNIAVLLMILSIIFASLRWCGTILRTFTNSFVVISILFLKAEAKVTIFFQIPTKKKNKFSNLTL